MANERPTIRLEYKEKHEMFHFEDLSNIKHEPNTCGWETIAERVNEVDALRFDYILDNLKIELGIGDSHKFTTDEIHRLWYMFSNAHKDLQSLIDEAKELDPERFE